MVTFKGGWGKLYYTQHTLLSNVGQLLILLFFFLGNKHTHTYTGERESGSNIKAYYNNNKLIDNNNCIKIKMLDKLYKIKLSELLTLAINTHNRLSCNNSKFENL